MLLEKSNKFINILLFSISVIINALGQTKRIYAIRRNKKKNWRSSQKKVFRIQKKPKIKNKKARNRLKTTLMMRAISFVKTIEELRATVALKPNTNKRAIFILKPIPNVRAIPYLKPKVIKRNK